MVRAAAGLGSSSGLMVSYCSRIMVSRAEGPGRSSGGSLSGEGADGEAGFFTACSWTRGRVAQLVERAQLPGDLRSDYRADADFSTQLEQKLSGGILVVQQRMSYAFGSNRAVSEYKKSTEALQVLQRVLQRPVALTPSRSTGHESTGYPAGRRLAGEGDLHGGHDRRHDRRKG